MQTQVFMIVCAAIFTFVWLIFRAVHARAAISQLNERVKLLAHKVGSLEAELREFRTGSGRAEVRESKPPAAKPAAAAPPVQPPASGPIMENMAPAALAMPKLPSVPPPSAPPILSKPARTAAVPPPLPRPETVQMPPANTASLELAASAVNPPREEKVSFEMRLGTYWLVRVGMIMLLTGLVFFANFAYHNFVGKLGPAGKISLLYLASGLLLGAGAWWQRRTVKESLQNYAQVLFAGGLAAFYFTTYAAHHIPQLQVIRSPVVDGFLLLAWAGFIGWLADRRKSEVMALFAIGLAFYSSVSTRVGEFTLYSNLVLTLASVGLLVRNRWAGLSLASLVTSYAGYLFWRFFQADGWRWATPQDGLWQGAAFLAAYWLIFTAATFVSRSAKLSGANRAAFLTLNNGAFFALFLLTMLQVRTGGFWKFSLGYGLVLLALSVLARKFLAAEPFARNSFLTQGLLLVTLGFLTRFAGLQLALILGAEAVTLHVLGTQRRSRVRTWFAAAAGTLAAGWCVLNLQPFDPRGLWTGAGLGVMLAFNAWWAHRQADRADSRPLRTGPAGYALLASVVWLATSWRNSTADHLPLVLAAETLALTFSFYAVRVRELTLLGQLFLVLAQGAWVFHFLTVTPPWWNPLALIAATIGLSHWWQRQTVLVVDPSAGRGWQAVYALAAIALVYVWLHPLVSAPIWLALSSLLAVLATGYGVATRAWPLAVGGQIFLAVSTWEFLQQLSREQPEWYFPLAPVAVFGLLSLATVRRLTRPPAVADGVRKPLLQLARVYRWIALVMSLVWVWVYVPESEQVWAFMLAAVAVCALAVWRRSPEALVAAGTYVLASLGTLWTRQNGVMDIHWPNLAAVLAPFCLQQILRRQGQRFPLDERIHGAIVFAAGLSLWRFLSCWTAIYTNGFFLTMSWAGFAVLAFAAGILLQERFLRWLGLGVLAAAVGRVVLVDVWRQETMDRVLTFMALGVALLLIGFLYNRYQETIRRWL